MTAVALTIAGSDPSGGAGLQADLKTFHQHGVYGMSVVTLLTAQNTQGVTAVELMPANFILDQLDAVLDDIPPKAAKSGALGSAGIISTVAAAAARFAFPLVVDPVMFSKHGHPLLNDDAMDALKFCLLPRAILVTPNLHEARALANMEIETREALQTAALAIAGLGPKNVLIKASQLQPHGADLLYVDGELHWLETERIDTRNLHGAGCVYSAAITAEIARGASLLESVKAAKRFIHEAIQTAPNLGGGIGPLNMSVSVDPAAMK